MKSDTRFNNENYAKYYFQKCRLTISIIGTLVSFNNPYAGLRVNSLAVLTVKLSTQAAAFTLWGIALLEMSWLLN